MNCKCTDDECCDECYFMPLIDRYRLYYHEVSTDYGTGFWCYAWDKLGVYVLVVAKFNKENIIFYTDPDHKRLF